jgi:hypothetical protein
MKTTVYPVPESESMECLGCAVGEVDENRKASRQVRKNFLTRCRFDQDLPIVFDMDRTHRLELTGFRLIAAWILSAVVTCFAGVESRADGVVRSDFVFQLNNSFFDSQAFSFSELLTGKEKIRIPDTEIFDQAPIRLQGIEVEFRYSMKGALEHVFLGAEQNLVSTEFSASVRIREVKVDSVIERKVGGAIVRARIRATCSNVVFDLPRGRAKILASLKASVGADGLPSLGIPWFRLDWNGGAWQPREVKCEGTKGFAERLSAGLANHLGDPARFVGHFKSAVDQRVTALQADVRSWFLTPKPFAIDVSGLKVTMYPRSIAQVHGNRFQIGGEIEFVFTNPRFNSVREVRGLGHAPTQSQFSLMVPEALVGTLNEMAQQSGFYQSRKSGREIEAFENLRSSSLSGWYVWPEIMNFNRQLDFLFDSWTTGTPRLSGLKARNDGVLAAQLALEMKTQNWAPLSQSFGHEKFSSFEVPMSGECLTYFATGPLGPELRVSFSSLNMDVRHEWDSVYVKKAKNTSVDTRTLRNEIRKKLLSDGLKFGVDKVRLNEKLQLVPSSFRQVPGWLVVDFK